MTWTFVMQLILVALILAVLVMVVAEALRSPGGNHREDRLGPPGPPGAPGPKGESGPPCQGSCCRPQSPPTPLRVPPPLRQSAQPPRQRPPRINGERP